jgi:hypothetical protein
LGSLAESKFDSAFAGQSIDDFCGAYFVAPLDDRCLPYVEVPTGNHGQTLKFLPYGANFFGKVNVVLGDLNCDGVVEIITSPVCNYAPWVRVFDLAGNLLHQFLAFSSTFKGGVDVAVGDINADGKLDIAASMHCSGSQVKVFKNVLASGASLAVKTCFTLHSSLYPFGSGFKGGAVVELADLGACVTVSGVKKLDSTQFDGRCEIVVGNQAGLRATIKAYSYFGTSTTACLVRTFLPFDAAFRGGVSLDIGLIDGDLVPDLIVGSGCGGASQVQVLSGATTGLISTFAAFQSDDLLNFNAKLEVQACDADLDGIVECLLAARDFDGKSREIRRFDALTCDLIDVFFENYQAN